MLLSYDDPLGYQLLEFPRESSPKLNLVIDVEAGFKPAKPIPRPDRSADAIDGLPRLLDVLGAVGARPVLAIAYSIADDPGSVEVIRPCLESDRAILASLFDPRVTPPFAQAPNSRNSMAGSLPPDLERQKISRMTEKLDAIFGVRPAIFRAPWYGVGDQTAEILADLGYRVDLSVPSYRYSGDDERPRSSNVGPLPFVFGRCGRLICFPHTGGFLGRYRDRGAKLHKALSTGRSLIARVRRSLYPGLGILQRVGLSPETCSIDQAKILVRALHAQGIRCFTIGLSSASLQSGHALHARSTHDGQTIVAWITEFLEFFSGEMSGQMTDPLSLRAAFAAGCRTRPLMSSRPSVSVIIPTFNRAALLSNAVESALQQTSPPAEIIVVDDGSTDETRAVVGRFGDKVRYIWQENAGVSAARNRGVEDSKGDLLAFLDSDDTWTPEKLRSHSSAILASKGAVIAFSDAEVVDGHGVAVHDSFFTRQKYFYSTYREQALFDSIGWIACGDQEVAVLFGDLSSWIFMGNLVMVANSVICARQAREAGLFDLRIGNAGEDYDFVSRLLQLGRAAFVCVQGARIMRGRDDHLSKASRLMANNNLKTIEALRRARDGRIDVPERMMSERVREAYSWIGLSEFQEGNMVAARRALMSAVRLGAHSNMVLSHLALTLIPKRVQDSIFVTYRSIRGARPRDG